MFASLLFAALVVLLVILDTTCYLVHGKIVGQNGCNIFNGNWMFDESYPLYDSAKCPFIEQQFDCQKNGRPDTGYMKYRWQPAGCKLPRFNGVDMLAKLKGKRLIFVGDSLSLNQWQSLTCMLHVAVPEAKYTIQRADDLSTFTFPAYDVTIMFFRHAFLVDLEQGANGIVLKLDSISTSKIWGGTDIMIFDSWHWWTHVGHKQPWNMIIHGNTQVKDMNRLTAYEMALNTWARWIDSNVDHTKTKVFFQGVSPDHASGQGSTAKNCAGQTELLKTIPNNPHPAELVLEKVLRQMNTPVSLLDITTLSQHRIDAHPSVYGHGGHNFLDCSHWCLSGVPDIWNEFLYAML